MAELTATQEGHLNLAIKNDAKRSLQQEPQGLIGKEIQLCHECLFCVIVLGSRAVSRVRSPSSMKRLISR